VANLRTLADCHCFMESRNVGFPASHWFWDVANLQTFWHDQERHAKGVTTGTCGRCKRQIFCCSQRSETNLFPFFGMSSHCALSHEHW
jgi:hypothetical protein